MELQLIHIHSLWLTQRHLLPERAWKSFLSGACLSDLSFSLQMLKYGGFLSSDEWKNLQLRIEAIESHLGLAPPSAPERKPSQERELQEVKKKEDKDIFRTQEDKRSNRKAEQVGKERKEKSVSTVNDEKVKKGKERKGEHAKENLDRKEKSTLEAKGVLKKVHLKGGQPSIRSSQDTPESQIVDFHRWTIALPLWMLLALLGFLVFCNGLVRGFITTPLVFIRPPAPTDSMDLYTP